MILNEDGLKKHWKAIPKRRKKILLKLMEEYIDSKNKWAKKARKGR